MRTTGSLRVLVVDDEPDAAEALTLLLEPRGYDVRVAATGDAAKPVVTAWNPHVVLLDLMLPDVNGLDLLRDFRTAAPDTQVVMVTGYGSVPKVVEAMNGGAFGFIEKPIDAMLLLAVLDKATEKLALAAENRRLRSELHDHASLDDMVARSDKMKQLFTMVRKVAPSDASVLILGENGTGKELVASAIHHNSKRARGPFIKINCAAIPSELIESELFGHKRGSFTGALADRPGVIELADGGSLLLDEIGEMPAALQAKLLRVLQEREFEPLGSERSYKVDVRVIAATHSDLRQMVDDGEFREDLYYRLNVIPVHIPPLRERKEDIPLLVQHFLEKFAAGSGADRPAPTVSQEAMRRLMAFHWPGNVRQLENAIERAVAFSAGRSHIDLVDLPAELQLIPEAFVPTSVTLPEEGIDLAAYIGNIERELITLSLERTNGNKGQAARLLNLNRTTLVEKLKRLAR